MNNHHCCAAAVSDSCSESFTAPNTKGATRGLTFARRGLDVGGWIVPGAIMALMPKCPACLAAYVAIWTGLGLSLPAATGLRTSLLILCVASMLYLAARHLRRWTAKSPLTARLTKAD